VEGELNEVGANICIGAAGRACTTTATTATSTGFEEQFAVQLLEE